MRDPCLNESGNPRIPESTIGLLRRWAMRQEGESCVGNRRKRGGGGVCEYKVLKEESTRP